MTRNNRGPQRNKLPQVVKLKYGSVQCELFRELTHAREPVAWPRPQPSTGSCGRPRTASPATTRSLGKGNPSLRQSPRNERDSRPARAFPGAFQQPLDRKRYGRPQPAAVAEGHPAPPLDLFGQRSYSGGPRQQMARQRWSAPGLAPGGFAPDATQP